MAVSGGPVVAKSGLVLSLDAGDILSYPRTGTSWNDLSVNAQTVTLTNGPTFSQTNLGNIAFDGVDDYADFSTPGLGTMATIEIWSNLRGTFSPAVGGGFVMGWNMYDIITFQGGLGFNTGNSDLYGISSSLATSLGLNGNWKHYVFEMRSDVSYVNNKIYVNGALQTLTQVASTETAANRSFNGGLGRISGWRLNNVNRYQMDVGVFKIYNRALTQAEVTGNFNALRARFSI